ncbi:hypothetical protein GGU11DRAFT_722267 [Lentinula aff. detonsa]|nr:hypothetical protein GGU11DRAFT_722267 [Lentinula aff. detonsa]
MKTFRSLKTRIHHKSTVESNTKAPASSKQAFRTTLNAAETCIRLLKELSDAVPFIGIAASAGVFIIEQCKRYSDNSQSFEELLNSVKSLDRLLSPYKAGDLTLTSEVTKSLELFDTAISDIRSEVERLQSSNRLAQFVNSAANESQVTDLIQKVKNAIDRIMLASLLDVSRGVREATRGIKDIALSQSLLSLNPVHGARYNCIDRDQCLDGTRVSVLDDIQRWFDKGEEQIYWLNGAAGMGKTTIALSVAHRLHSNPQLLLATFFCSRESVDRKNPGLIFPTIACQLASWNHEFQDILVEVLAHYPYVGSALPHEQFQKLIVEPLEKLNPPTTVALVIDALDECDGERASEKILLALLQHVHSTPSLKVFVSCRPAAYVEDLLSSGEHRRMFKLHHVPTGIVNDDLRLYYRQRLEGIRVAKKLGSTDWLTEELIEKLVVQAAGLFIFAVTVCKYIDSRGDARRQLEHITSLTKGKYDNALSIDMLYTEVLSAALQKIPDSRDRRDFARILASVVHAQQPLTINALGQLLGLEPSIVYDLLRDVHSILFVPNEFGALSDEVVHIFHASFPDYMTARNRVGEEVPSIYINSQSHQLEMSLCCLRCLNRELKRILPLSKDPSPLDTDQCHLLLQTHISKALSYAIIYWADHFSSTVPDKLRDEGDPLLEELQQFAGGKLLFWFECICLLNASEIVIRILVKGKNALMSLLSARGFHKHPTLQLLEDAYHAANEFFPILQAAYAKHIYLTFLLFLPQETSLYRHYSHHLPPDWKVTGQQRRTRNPLVRSLGLSPFSDTVTFSPDERNILDVDYYMASANILSSVQLAISQILPESPVFSAWDYEKIPGVDAPFPKIVSNNLQPGMVSTIWLPSGKIVSCCTLLSDIEMPHRCYCYVSLWDSETGAHIRLLHKTMEGTNMFLPVIKASPDFRYVGYSNPSVQLFWDTETWDEIIFLSSHTRFYRCFAVSNTHYLVGTEIRDVSRESLVISNLDIEPQQVASCVFSWDGQVIVLGLISGFVEVWRVASSSEMVANLQLSSIADYSGALPLPSLASSPRSNFIVVCFGTELYLLLIANDSIACAGYCKSPYSAHLRAVSYSPGGQFVACRDNNGLVHVWSTEAILDPTLDLNTSRDESTPGSTSCLTYMADSRLCLSGAHDGTLSIWECDTGSLVQTWAAQINVIAVSASSDGRFIASSGLKETRIWSLPKMDCPDSKLKPQLELIIAAPPETVGFIPAICAVTFSSDSTMLAIVTGFIVDIWKLTESKWQRYTQLKTSLTRFVPNDDAPVVDDFIQGSSSLLRALRFNYQWLAHFYHKLHVRAPFYLRRQISETEYEKSLQQCRSAFEWWKLSEGNSTIANTSHSQLYFSLDGKYILVPSGIYEIATGQELANHEMILQPWEDDKSKELEVKYFWKTEREYYRRNGIFKTLHPIFHHRPNWIADTEGHLCFWVPESHFRGKWLWYSCASDGDRFAFISRDDSNLIFIHVPGVGTTE